MNPERRVAIFVLVSAALVLAACGGAPAAAVVPTPAPGMPTIEVVEHTALPSVVFMNSPNPVQAKNGKQYYAVAVHFAIAGDTYSTMLKLDDVKLTAGDGSTFAPVTLTLGPGKHTVADLMYYPHIGKGDNTLDFGVGFEGMDMTMTEVYGEGVKDALTVYHGSGDQDITFLFEIPANAVPASLQLPEFPQMTLE